MPRPTPPVKRVCYADDITVWATGPKIPQLESMINNYLREVSIYLKDNNNHSDMLSAQYLVNCLEEDHVSHGITIQEPRPLPMKETLYSRHHSTVLPRLGSSRMKRHQNLNTHAVDSTPRKQHPQYRTRSRDSTEDNDALSPNYGQDTAIYFRTTSIGC